MRDVLLPAAIAALGAGELAVLRPQGWGYGVALECVACALLLWRRRTPLVVCPLATVVLLTMPWFGPQLDQPSTPIAIIVVVGYSLARYLRDLRGLAGVAVMALALFVDYALVDQRHHDMSDVFFASALIVPPYVLGRLTRKLADQAMQLERQQELVRCEAVRIERDRIARELHDEIAHSVSAMVVQTAAAQDLVRVDPGHAEGLLADVAATGRRALAETGRLLYLIRDENHELGLTPAPGTAQLTDLAERFRRDGLTVDMRVAGPTGALPVTAEVSAYRIVQEALTNALRYSADRAASVRLSSTPTALRIQVVNACGTRRADGSGLGLVGMAERVSLLGGTLTHGVVDGRFELTAVLPVARQAEPA